MASEKVKTFTDADFGESVKNGVVLVDFWADLVRAVPAPGADRRSAGRGIQRPLTVAKVEHRREPDDAEQVHGARHPDAAAVQERRPQGNRRRPGDKDDLAQMIDKHL